MTCERHPDRRAGVRCQRCERPMCPSCMHEASVGFHCPQCVASSAQTVHTARTLLATATPYVTYALVAVNLVIFFVDSSGATIDGNSLAREGGIFAPLVAQGEWYRIFTSGFLHGGLIHVGFNMFLLWQLGQHFERELGPAVFLAGYVTSLIAGSLGVIVLEPDSLAIGASGAVFGLFGIAVAFQLAAGINPLDTQIGSLVALNLFITFIPGLNISIGGHLGGLAGGLLCGFALTTMRDNDVPWAARLAVLVGFGAAAFGAALALA